LISIEAASVGGLFHVSDHKRDVGYWHLTDKPTAPIFVAYWTNNGQKSAQGLNGSAAFDPKQSSGARKHLVEKSL